MHSNDLNAFYTFKKYRSGLSEVIKKSKYDYFKERIQNTTNDTKKLWNMIREATNDFQKQTDIK